jgi:nitrite reductase/ring-hydroxylating ferredoxin subunit
MSVPGLSPLSASLRRRAALDGDNRGFARHTPLVSEAGTQTPLARVRLDTLVDRKPIRVRHPPFDVVLVLVDDEVFALEDACNHSSASLSEGFVAGDCLVCPAHGFSFALRDGELVDPPGRCDDQRAYAVRIVDGEAWVLPRPTEVASP